MIKLLAFMYFISGTTNPEIARAIYNFCEPDLQKLAVAIAFKESSFRNLSTNDTGDTGVYQINSIHGKSKSELLDIDKSTEFACRLLKMHRKHAATDRMWWARYHSKTPSLKKKYYHEVWEIIAKGRFR